MKLLTAEIKKKIPALYAQEELGTDAIVHVKFFNPQGQGTWYATEACAMVKDGEGWISKQLKHIRPEDQIIDIRFFGLVDLQEKELGYFSFNELSEYRGRFGLGIERDMHFTRQPVKNFL